MVKDAPLTKKSGLLRRGGCDAESESSESRPRLPSRQRDEISEPSLNTLLSIRLTESLAGAHLLPTAQPTMMKRENIYDGHALGSPPGECIVLQYGPRWLRKVRLLPTEGTKRQARLMLPPPRQVFFHQAAALGRLLEIDDHAFVPQLKIWQEESCLQTLWSRFPMENRVTRGQTCVTSHAHHCCFDYTYYRYFSRIEGTDIGSGRTGYATSAFSD